MEYEAVDHVPFWDWGAWPETIERWKAEGFDPARNPAAICDQRQWVGHWFFPNPPFERKVISEDARHVVYVNHEGILMMERRDQPYSSMPQFLKFPVETREEFLLRAAAEPGRRRAPLHALLRRPGLRRGDDGRER